jgi:hypothetical protein
MLKHSRLGSLRSRLTYANVTSTLALIVALSGGVAYAASKIQSADLAQGAVHTSNLFKRAIISGKLAVGAVRRNQIADGAVGAKQIGSNSVTPSNLQFPVSFAASPTGGEARLAPITVSYPITGGTWAQSPGEVNLILGTATATLASDGHGPCEVKLEVSLNGHRIGGTEVSTGTSFPAPVEHSLGSQFEIDPTTATTNKLTVNLSANEHCTSESHIDSTRFRVLDFG